MTTGPTEDARPKVAAHKGHNAADTATLCPRRTAPARNGAGQRSGTEASSFGENAMIAAQAPTLIKALGDNAAAGDAMRSPA